MSFWLPVFTLMEREMLRFWRQKSRVAGFVGSPLIFWLLIGSGFGDLGFFFPGALTLTVMFSAIFSMMSLIEDRKEGFLLGVLVSPAPRGAIVLGKILGACTLAWVQGMMLLCFLPLTGLPAGASQIAAIAGALFAISFTFTALGFLFAWKIDSTQGFHAIMNLVLLPLWLVSGALFSMSGAATWMQWLMRLNPLTYSVAALKRLLDPAAAGEIPSLTASLGLTISCGVLLWIASTMAASRRPRRSAA